MTVIVRKPFTRGGRLYVPGDRLEVTSYHAQPLLDLGEVGFPTAQELELKTPADRYERRDLRAEP